LISRLLTEEADIAAKALDTDPSCILLRIPPCVSKAKASLIEAANIENFTVNFENVAEPLNFCLGLRKEINNVAFKGMISAGQIANTIIEYSTGMNLALTLSQQKPNILATKLIEDVSAAAGDASMATVGADSSVYESDSDLG